MSTSSSFPTPPHPAPLRSAPQPLQVNGHSCGPAWPFLGGWGGLKPTVPHYPGNAETPDLYHLEAPTGTFPSLLSLTLPEFSPAKIVIAFEKESRQPSLSGSLERGTDVLTGTESRDCEQGKPVLQVQDSPTRFLSRVRVPGAPRGNPFATVGPPRWETLTALLARSLTGQGGPRVTRNGVLRSSSLTLPL